MTAPVVPRGQVTARQREALVLAANGLTSVQIARRLGASKTAVDLRLGYAARSLGARSRAHAVAVAMVLGLIGPEEIRVPEALSGSVGPVDDSEAPGRRRTAVREPDGDGEGFNGPASPSSRPEDSRTDPSSPETGQNGPSRGLTRFAGPVPASSPGVPATATTEVRR